MNIPIICVSTDLHNKNQNHHVMQLIYIYIFAYKYVSKNIHMYLNSYIQCQYNIHDYISTYLNLDYIRVSFNLVSRSIYPHTCIAVDTKFKM